MFKKLKPKSHYTKKRDLVVYEEERNLCTEYGLKNKRELGRYYSLAKKYRSLGRREGTSSNPYLLAIKSLNSKGVLSETQSMQEITPQRFLSRRLQTLVSKIGKITISASRFLINTGKVKIGVKTYRFPGMIVSKELEKLITLNNFEEKLKTNA